MAIYHLSVKTVSRSAGRSATAAAAYRAGVEIVDERTGLVFDYTRRSGVDRDHSPGLVLPEGSPAWAADRAALWNAAEKAETRKNSTVAREFELAIPDELTPEQGGALVREFAQALAKRHGIAVDAQIHEPGREGDSRNRHAHVLTSTRRLGPNGFGEKARELDDQKTGPAIVTEWRATWAEMSNQALGRAGVDARIDHRTLAAQGIEREATQHLGPQATAMERQGVATRIGDENRAVVIDFAARQAERAEAAALDREVKAIEARLYDLAQERAKRDQARQEAERYARMSSRELSAEITRLRPPSVDSLLPRHPEVVKARQGAAMASQAHGEAARAGREAEAWRKVHPWKARAQRWGLWRWKHVEELDAKAAQAPGLWERYEKAAQVERRTLAETRQEIEISQLGAWRKVEALEKVRDGKAMQERAEQRIEAGIDEALRAFTNAARMREMRAHGWGDGGRHWEAIPAKARAIVSSYNAMDEQAKSRTLASFEQQLRRDPSKADDFAKPFRGRDHGHDMGMSR